MSFRFGLPIVQPDPRMYRDEELPSSRLAASQSRSKQSRPGILDNDNQTALRPILPTPSAPNPAAATSSATSPAPRRRHVVTPDPVAFRYLEEDPSVTVVERRAPLQGYELYLVEQWACSRQSPTLVITTFTGDPNHTVIVGVLAIPEDEKDWSARLKAYFKTMQQYHARPKECQFGEIMATNLSSFPSALTVIAVPDGDVRRHRQEFIINEDLKRLGCSGRSGLTLSSPTRATQERFLSLYKTSEKIPFTESVLELIKQCQIALFIFGVLDGQYIDGLLCDMTEKAVNDWWAEVGAEYYNSEPADGILGPTTVAALLGMLMGARNRLAWHGAPISKDVFDIDNMKKGIGAFQKTYKLERTRRLDHQTLRRLHSVTTKAAAGEGGWGVQKAIKSTVEGFGGKRGEIVIGMVGGKDKGNIGDIETLDIDKFISLVYGDRPKWLWFGKTRRALAQVSSAPDSFHERASTPDTGGGFFSREDISSQPSRRAASVPLDGEDAAAPDADGTQQKKEVRTSIYSTPPPDSALSMSDSPNERDRDLRRRTMFKSVAGKVNDARSGLGRIRDAVGGGLRGHASRPSRDETPSSAIQSTGSATRTAASMSSVTSPGIASLAEASLNSPLMVGRAFTWKNKPEEYLNNFRRERELADGTTKESSLVDMGLRDQDADKQQIHSSGLVATNAEVVAAAAALEAGVATAIPGFASQANGQASHIRKDIVATTNTSVAGSVAGEADLEGPFLGAERSVGPKVVDLLRRHSIASERPPAPQPPFDILWRRRMSFSVAEDAVLGWEDIVVVADVDEDAGEEERDEGEGDGRSREEQAYDRSLLAASAPAALAKYTAALTPERCLYDSLSSLKDIVGPVVLDRVTALETLDSVYAQQLDEVQSIFFQLSDAYERVQESSQELLGLERAQATEAVREIEMLMARVEYEISSLASKVQDVEEGVRQFTQQVEYVEKRADELKQQLETESWLHWFVRTVTGIGTGPNIIHGPPPRRRS